MSTKCVINVDLADVWAGAGRKKFLRTLAWGDEVTVTRQTATAIEIETVYFNEQPDGSILPVKEAGFIEPKTSSGLKAAAVVRPRSQNDVLKVNCVDVQQGDGAVIESPDTTSAPRSSFAASSSATIRPSPFSTRAISASKCSGRW